MDICWISMKQNIYRHPALIWTTPDFLSEIREGFGFRFSTKQLFNLVKTEGKQHIWLHQAHL